jgi:ATP synthase protein I
LADPEDRERGSGEDKGLSGLAEGYRKAAPYMAASSSLVGAVGVFTFLGYLADRKLGNEVPWLTMLGAVLGMTGGFISFFRQVLKGKK